MKMEMNRRNFIKFAVGSVAGIHLSPLPWKLTDDIAIWTQNWGWVPRPERGEFNHIQTVCTLCPGSCGIEVRRVEERCVKIEGRTDYPVNPGGICPIGAGGLQLLYNEDIRFTGPMKRVGPRGSGQFKDISWDEAITLLTSRITTLRAKSRPEAIAAIDGHFEGTTVSVLIHRLMEAIGSPNYMRMPSISDTYWTVGALMQGTEGPMAYDLENADFILSFGCGLLEGWGAPGRVLAAWGQWKQKGSKVKVVQIEPLASNTASKADQWLAPRPGTEAALALGIASVLVKEGLYDKAFVKNYCFGFEDWRSSDGKAHRGFKGLLLSKYTPERVSRITGLSKEQIVATARAFGRAKAPIAIFGKGKGTWQSSLYESMAIHSLNALVGNINKPGGVLIHEPLPLTPLPRPSLDDLALSGLKKDRLDGAGSFVAPFAKSLVVDFAKALYEENGYRIDTVMIFSANPAYSLPDQGLFKKALRKIPFIVSFSPFRDETALMADLILPDHTALEKFTDMVWPLGLQYPLYAVSNPALAPVYNTRNSGDVILTLASKLGGSIADSFPWDSFEEVVKFRARGLYESGSGIIGFDSGASPPWAVMKKQQFAKPNYKDFDEMWEGLQERGVWYRPAHTYGMRERLFKTPTGKFEFYSTQIELAIFEAGQKGSKDAALEEMGIEAKGDEVCMPHFEQLEHETEQYPLKLVPYEIINLSSGFTPSPPFVNKTLFDHQLLRDHSFVDINPETAAKYHLKQGDLITIETPGGSAQVKVNLFEGAMPGYVFMLRGLGHTGYDEFWKGKGANPNHLIGAAKDPLSGTPVWWVTPAKIVKGQKNTSVHL